MTILEFIQSIKDGKVTFEWNGHNFSHDQEITYQPELEEMSKYGTTIRATDISRFVESIERRADLTFRMAEKYEPPPGTKSTPEDNERMQEYYRQNAKKFREEHLEFPCDDLLMLTPTEYHCFDCGKRLIFYVESPSLIRIVENRYENSTGKWGHGTFTIYKDPCQFKDGVPPSEVEIDVPTGRLVFVNFFGNYEEHDPQGDDRYGECDLNTSLGRINLAKHYAKQNIGYGQMGNMSIGIYCDKKSNKIIIGNAYNPMECDSFKEGEKEYEDWKKECDEYDSHFGKGKATRRGQISCEVWRWMCSDASFIDKKYWKPKEYSDDPVVVRVKPGRYKIRHMFRSDTEHSEMVYSTIERVGDIQ